MARKKLGTAAKVLGGLGAAYLASGHIRPGVQPEDVDTRSEAQKQRDAEAIAKIPRYSPSAIELEERVHENARRRAGRPVVTDAEQAEIFSGIKNLARTESGVPIRTSDGFLGTQYKKGGAVKGWGKARGARKAKVY